MRNTKIGDIFLVNLGDYKKYFQYIADDLTQLNSNVIRAFKKKYTIDSTPDTIEIVKGEIDFYAHCIIKLGIKKSLWNKVGNESEISGLDEILFRDTNDYARRGDEEPIKISNNWYVWKINQPFIRVGKLDWEHKKSYLGLVINPKGILELLKGNEYPSNYPK
ncbi:MAG TPA: hypothetical protein VHA56_08690 [Mucilaginibacter sp.]|nr:hypothetical protein [Mucilaginibacter sp.]